MRLEIHKNNLCPKDSVVKIPGVAGYGLKALRLQPATRNTQPEIRNGSPDRIGLSH